jgi:hypothetical protein
LPAVERDSLKRLLSRFVQRDTLFCHLPLILRRHCQFFENPNAATTAGMVFQAGYKILFSNTVCPE